MRRYRVLTYVTEVRWDVCENVQHGKCAAMCQCANMRKSVETSCNPSDFHVKLGWLVEDRLSAGAVRILIVVPLKVARLCL